MGGDLKLFVIYLTLILPRISYSTYTGGMLLLPLLYIMLHPCCPLCHRMYNFWGSLLLLYRNVFIRTFHQHNNTDISSISFLFLQGSVSNHRCQLEKLLLPWTSSNLLSFWTDRIKVEMVPAWFRRGQGAGGVICWLGGDIKEPQWPETLLSWFGG